MLGTVRLVKVYDTLSIAPVLPTELQPLNDLAKNLRWSWRPEAQELFAEADPQTWEASGGNPIRVLAGLSASRARELANDTDFLRRMHDEVEDLERYLASPRWYENAATDAGDNDTLVAYFSMEFGITQSLPVYSGGLGVLAGDHMKSASDLGVPIIGIGLMYTYGYFSQSLSADGWQQENYEAHPPQTLPVEPVTDEQGEQVHVSVTFPDHNEVHIALYVAKVGRVPLLLLDTNIERNSDDARTITDRLYGGDIEHRIKQELILGVGGLRAVQAFCRATGRPQPSVVHMNEGHAGFSGIERMSQLMQSGADFESALTAVRASTVFTTHTPVPAGIDRFDAHLAHRYLNPDERGESQLCPSVPVERVIALGAEDDPSRFNMAHLGLRLAQYANGVAKLHGEVSRAMFQGLYPNVPVNEVPITSITNGVHTPTWTSPRMRPVVDAMANGANLATATEWTKPDAVSDEELWAIRNDLRHDLIQTARASVTKSWMARGSQPIELRWVQNLLDENTLTIGFARRVATYKRLTLMLTDRERLARILTNPDRPVQFVIAGKAHPADMGGKQLLQELVRFADEAGVRDRIVFLPDYNVSLASVLCAGADVWMNNPIRPQEASGTSGMKVVMNGGLTFSISDGWWDEARDDSLGWTIPDALHGDAYQRDAWESDALYSIIENEIAPMFYDRDEAGIPREWLSMMRRSMTELGPKFAAERMVRDYVEQLYLPAGRSSRAVAGERAASFAEWQRHVRDAWPQVAVESARVEEQAPQAGENVAVSATLRLGSLSADDVRVELVFGPTDGHGELVPEAIVPMEPVAGSNEFRASFTADVPGAFGWTVRVVPHHELLGSFAEMGLVRTPADFTYSPAF